MNLEAIAAVILTYGDGECAPLTRSLTDAAFGPFLSPLDPDILKPSQREAALATGGWLTDLEVTTNFRALHNC